MEREIDMTKEQEALKKLLDTIVATGGLIEFEDGTYGCEADEDWLDLADCALLAQEALRCAGIAVEVPITKREYLQPAEQAGPRIREADELRRVRE